MRNGSLVVDNRKRVQPKVRSGDIQYADWYGLIKQRFNRARMLNLGAEVRKLCRLQVVKVFDRMG
jgi:hypothetical protein